MKIHIISKSISFIDLKTDIEKLCFNVSKLSSIPMCSNFRDELNYETNKYFDYTKKKL